LDAIMDFSDGPLLLTRLRCVRRPWWHGNLVISMTANQPPRRHRVREAVRRAARPGTLAVALVLSPVIGTVVGESSGPAEAATRTYTYKVCYAGRIVAGKPYFKKFVAATYADSRGWRRAGIRFVRKDYTCTRLSNTDFTVYLATPSYIDNFAGCSAAYNCRYGRHVMINQQRWLHAVSFWPSPPGLHGYRQMIINHETGHWLGQHHRNCPGPGANAPVMQQQSISLQGCRAHAWPLSNEIRSVRSTMP
jgi:uncharacterized protein DUF3152